jgi:hypothetical protein
MADHEAFKEGYDAYWDGLDREGNPYCPHGRATQRKYGVRPNEPILREKRSET